MCISCYRSICNLFGNAPGVVDKGVVKEVFLCQGQNGSAETNYIISVGDRYYNAKPGNAGKPGNKVYQKGDEVRFIAYGNSKTGFII